jgi:hypothetical protein
MGFAKENTKDTIYFVVGNRKGNEGDEQDYQRKTKNVETKYPNTKIKLITTSLTDISGTQTRDSLKSSPKEFYKYLPKELTDKEKEEVYNMVKSSIKETLNENASYSKDIDVKSRIMQLTQHMLDKGYNIEPLPTVEFVDGDSENAREFLGKTAYYNPNNQTIVLYTEGRHPKDIVRSFAHEMIHHIQNLEGRLGAITTTNTQEDDHLNDIEAEANLKGTMTFRNWTDSLNEGINEYDNVGPSTPKVYIVKDDGTYKEAPIELLSKISNLTYDMGGGETNYYPDKNIVIVDNIPVEEFAKEPGDIKGEKVYVEYNLNNSTSLPKANKIIASQLVYHLDNHEAFAQTIANSLKDGGTFEFQSDKMNKKDKMFLQHLSDEYGFGLPTKLNQYKQEPLPLKKGKFIEPVISYIYKITDKDGKTSTLSTTKKGNGWEWKKIDGDIDFKTGGWSQPPEDTDPDFKSKERTLRSFNKYLSYFGDSNTIVDFEKLNEANKPYKHKHGFDDKLGKDPFGLNAYALELARGLEEALNENPSEVQKKKININFELWTGRKISEDIILAMSPDSQGVFELGDNIEKYTGLSLKDATKYNESPDDVYIYGLVSTMNDGQDIFFWTNGTRLAGNAEKYGAWPAIIEQLAHEGLHLARAILAKSVMKDEFPTGEWPSIGEQDNDTIEEEELTTSVSFVIEQIAPSFIEMAKAYIPELKNQRIKENVAPNHDGKAAPFGSGYKEVNEGRYDTLTNQLSRIAFESFKDIHDRGDKKGKFSFRVDHPDDEHDIPSKEFYFDFEGRVEITDDEYKVDGGVNAGFDDKGNEVTPLLSVKFKIPKNPDWQKVSFDIKDVVRHELEHLTQDGDNIKGGTDSDDPKLRRPSKYMDDDQLIRDLIDADMLPKSQYFKLEKEIDAMLQGLYFKAKKSKRPFGDVIDDYLNIFLDQETISPQEKEDILNIWRSRRKALSLPVFENKVMENKYKIYLDMDGVIVDFDKRFTDLAGMGPREYESSFGKEKFWDFIDSKEKGGGVGFWVGMDWMPGGEALYNRVAQHDHALLSSPSKSESSRIGKHRWKKKYTPSTKLILALAKNKQNYADGNNILIDDRESNIQQWREAGGIGILYKSADQVNKELDKLGL